MSTMQPEQVALTIEELNQRASQAAQYEREARERGDVYSARYWSERYEELDDRAIDLLMKELS